MSRSQKNEAGTRANGSGLCVRQRVFAEGTVYAV